MKHTYTVVRTGQSPMNPKVKWAELSCGHEVWIHPPKRTPRIGSLVECERCRRALEAQER